MLRRPRAQGFTLTEVMIAVALVGILLMLGLPAFGEFLANSRVRNATESLQGGLQIARSEAIKRNREVEFLLFGDPSYDLGQVATVTANAAGPNWLVRVRDPATGVYDHIDWQSGYEGGGQAESGAPATTIAATYPAGSVPADIVAFNPLGGTGLAGTALFDVSKPEAGACAGANGPIRCLRVQVSVAGQVRMCDPAVGAGDTRSCD